MAFNGLKALAVFVLLFSSAFAVVTITSDKEAYHCGFDVKPGVYACEDVHLTIYSTKHYRDVSLVFPYDYKNGEIDYVIHKGRKHHSRFSNRWLGKKEVDLNSFELFPGTTEITITPIAHGTFKWDAVLLDSRGNELAVLDPWFNTSFLYRHELNLTSSTNTLTDYQVKIILNSSNINYSNTNDDGSDLRFTWLNQTSGQEQEISYWIYNWDESGNSEVWIKAPLIDTDGEIFYYYYGNSTPVNTTSNGTATFEFFDDFNDLSQWNVSGTAVATTVDGKTVMNMSGNPTYVYNSFTTQNNFIMFDLKEEAPGAYGSRVRVGLRFDQASDAGYTWDLRPNFVLGRKDSGAFTSLADYGSGISSGVWYRGMIRGYGSNLEAYLNSGSLSATDSTYSSGVNLFFNTWDGEIVYFDYIAVGKYLGDTITQSFGSEEKNSVSIDILTPTNNSEHFSEDGIELTFSISSVYTNENYNIYVDGVLNKTVNVTSTQWTENFNMTAGQHNITVTYAANESNNDTVVFTVKDFMVANVQYDGTEYELMYSTFNATIRHLENLSTNESTLYYFNGTNSSTSYSMTITTYNSTTDYATVTIFTPFLGAYSNKTYNFTINATANDSSYKDGYNNTQTVIQGYYINSTNVSQSTIVEGGLETSNITVVMKTNYAVVTAYSTLNGTVTEGTETGSSGEAHYWKTEYHVPSVNTSTEFNVTYFITVSYGGITATRQYSGYNNITVKPISIGYCDATNTVQILNYSLWDEDDYDQQLPITNSSNEWEARIVASAPNGTVSKTFGFKNTTQNLLICSTGDNLSLNTSVWAWDNASNFVKRSHFMLNHLVSNTLEHIKIRTLNASLASVIDFYVYDVYNNPQANRIIKFYKYYPESNEYEEIFNLITDIQGHATAKLKAYDTWYKIIVVDADGTITKNIPIIQISSSTISIIEELLSGEGSIYDLDWSTTWNNASKVLTVTINSNTNHEVRLVTEEIGVWSNETYCDKTFNGTSGVLYCDLSNSTVTEFQWKLYVKKYDQWVGIDFGIVRSTPQETPLGFFGLLATSLFVMTGSLLFSDFRMRLVGGMTGLTISWVFKLVVVEWAAIVGLWFAVAVILYVTRDEARS